MDEGDQVTLVPIKIRGSNAPALHHGYQVRFTYRSMLLSVFRVMPFHKLFVLLIVGLFYFGMSEFGKVTC